MGDYFSYEAGPLANKLGINDPDLLKEIEAKIVMLRLLELEESPLEGTFDFDHLCRIHHFLFSDIYDFAGQIRDVRLAKGSSVFCYPENIESAQHAIFTKLKRDELLTGLSQKEFVTKLAHLGGELIALHPFREGNGRTSRVFLKELASSAGYDLRYEDVDASRLLEADIAAFSGDLNPLMDVLSAIVSPIVG